MPTEHRVQKGECLASIALQYGFTIEQIWTDPANRGLREVRTSPYVLLQGDVVVIPDPQIRTETCETGRRHIFRRKGVPERLQVQIHSLGVPRADLPYQLEIDGRTVEGTTDGEGWLRAWIPPDARSGRITLNETDVYEIRLGYLDPATEDSGVRERLANLGFLDPQETGEDACREAIATFQYEHGLPSTGTLDDATHAALLKASGI